MVNLWFSCLGIEKQTWFTLQIIFMYRHIISAWKDRNALKTDKTKLHNLIIVSVCDKLPKTCRNTVCASLACKERFSAGVWVLVFPVLSITHWYSLVWRIICWKGRRKVGILEIIYFPLRLSFVNQTMLHITVNLVLFDIYLKMLLFE